MSKTLKATISGSFVATDKEIESFDRVTGIIPCLDTEHHNGEKLSKAEQMLIRRYARVWIEKARKKEKDGSLTEEPKYKRVKRVREVQVDSVDENDDAPNDVLPYVGKDIMDMDWEDIQDFAAANDLSAVPLYRVGSLFHQRKVAWSEAARKILGNVGPEFMWTNEHFNPSKFEPIVADDQIRRAGGHVASIEETIDREALALKQKTKAETDAIRKVPVDATASDSKLTIDQLKAIADDKKIKYSATIGWKQLYDKIYGAKKVA